jgi:hypothetical protein
MIAVGDPNTGRVAVELMLDRDPSVAARFVPVLRSLNCPVINATLERGGRLVNEFAGVH